MYKFINLVLLIICILTLTGCSEEKTYSDNGIKITMTKGLFKKNHPNASIYYENDEIFVIGIKEKFNDLLELDINESSTIEQYAKEVFNNQGKQYDLKKENGLYYFTYEYEINENKYYYVSTIHKSHNAFWICNFACQYKNKDKYHNLFLEWGQSITFY